MFTQKSLITSLMALSFSALASAASATGSNTTPLIDQSVMAQNSGTVDALQNANTPQISPANFDRFQMKYMRETYQDVKITLLGPIKFGVSEDIIEHRFSNVDVNYGPRVQRPDYAGQFDTATYLRATAAKTSVKFKF